MPFGPPPAPPPRSLRSASRDGAPPATRARAKRAGWAGWRAVPKPPQGEPAGSPRDSSRHWFSPASTRARAKCMAACIGWPVKRPRQSGPMNSRCHPTNSADWRRRRLRAQRSWLAATARTATLRSFAHGSAATPCGFKSRVPAPGPWAGSLWRAWHVASTTISKPACPATGDRLTSPSLRGRPSQTFNRGGQFPEVRRSRYRFPRNSRLSSSRGPPVASSLPIT